MYPYNNNGQQQQQGDPSKGKLVLEQGKYLVEQIVLPVQQVKTQDTQGMQYQTAQPNQANMVYMAGPGPVEKGATGQMYQPAYKYQVEPVMPTHNAPFEQQQQQFNPKQYMQGDQVQYMVYQQGASPVATQHYQQGQMVAQVNQNQVAVPNYLPTSVQYHNYQTQTGGLPTSAQASVTNQNPVANQVSVTSQVPPPNYYATGAQYPNFQPPPPVFSVNQTPGHNPGPESSQTPYANQVAVTNSIQTSATTVPQSPSDSIAIQQDIAKLNQQLSEFMRTELASSTQAENVKPSGTVSAPDNGKQAETLTEIELMKQKILQLEKEIEASKQAGQVAKTNSFEPIKEQPTELEKQSTEAITADEKTTSKQMVESFEKLDTNQEQPQQASPPKSLEKVTKASTDIKPKPDGKDKKVPQTKSKPAQTKATPKVSKKASVNRKPSKDKNRKSTRYMTSDNKQSQSKESQSKQNQNKAQQASKPALSEKVKDILKKIKPKDQKNESKNKSKEELKTKNKEQHRKASKERSQERTIPSLAEACPTKMIAPDDYKQFYHKESNTKTIKAGPTGIRVPSDAPTALIAPDDYQDLYHKQTNTKTVKVVGTSKVRVPSDAPTALIAPDDYQDLYHKQTNAKTVKVPTALIAPDDYVHLFNNEKQIDLTKRVKAVVRVPSNTPTALIAPDDYQDLPQADKSQNDQSWSHCG